MISFRERAGLPSPELTCCRRDLLTLMVRYNVTMETTKMFLSPCYHDDSTAALTLYCVSSVLLLLVIDY